MPWKDVGVTLGANAWCLSVLPHLTLFDQRPLWVFSPSTSRFSPPLSFFLYKYRLAPDKWSWTISMASLDFPRKSIYSLKPQHNLSFYGFRSNSWGHVLAQCRSFLKIYKIRRSLARVGETVLKASAGEMTDKHATFLFFLVCCFFQSVFNLLFIILFTLRPSLLLHPAAAWPSVSQ